MLKKSILTGSSTMAILLVANAASAADYTFPDALTHTYDGSQFDGSGTSYPTASVDFANNAGTLTVSSGASLGAVTNTGGNSVGTINFSGSSNILYDVAATGATLSAVNINGGTVTLNNTNYYVDTTTVASGATLAVTNTGTQTINGGLTVNGTLDLRSAGNNTSIATDSGAGNLSVSSTGSVKIKISGDGDNQGAANAVGNTSNITHLTVAGTTGWTNGATVQTSLSNLNITSGTRYILASGTGALTLTTGDVTVTGTPWITWTVRAGDGGAFEGANDTYLVATTVNSVASVATSTTSKGVATSLAGITSPTSEMQTLISAISSLTTASAVDKALAQLAPSSSVNMATAAGSAATTTANMNVISTRSNNVRAAQAGRTGFASGNSLRGLGLWMQGFGTSGSQDARQGVDGYDVLTGGAAFGGDVQVAKSWRLGAAMAYGHTKVDSTGDSKGSGVEFDSYQASLYSNYTAKRWYADTTLTYGRHQYDGTRQISFSGFDQTAKNSHAGNQYTAQVAGGVPLVWKNVLFTPNMSLTYSMLQQDAYTETGASGANLSVDQQTSNSFKTGLGIKASKSFSKGKNRVIPEVRASWFHEYVDSGLDQTARFSSGGSSFTTAGVKPASDSFVAGLGLTLARGNNVTISANYDAEMKEAYLGHNGTLQFRYNF